MTTRPNTKIDCENFARLQLAHVRPFYTPCLLRTKRRERDGSLPPGYTDSVMLPEKVWVRYLMDVTGVGKQPMEF